MSPFTPTFDEDEFLTFYAYFYASSSRTRVGWLIRRSSNVKCVEWSPIHGRKR